MLLSVAGRCLFILIVAALGWAFSSLLRRFVRLIFKERGWDPELLEPLAQISRLLLILLPIQLCLPLLKLDPVWHDWLRHGLSLLCIWLVTVFLFRSATLGRSLILQRYEPPLTDPPTLVSAEARKAQTQIVMLESILKFLILLSGLSMALMTFDRIRQVGVSLLASAGLAGIVLGFAAQKLLSTLIAGIQIALTQPIRIDDAVFVEGEFGTIEDITLTYVVVRLWDLRRLVVPTPSFIDKPFQNWSRTSLKMLGAILFHTDYTVPVAELRAELERLCQGHPLWNGETCSLQVADALPHTLQLRALVSADDPGKLGELRAELREKLILWLQTHHPESLPRQRVELATPSALDIGRIDIARVDIEKLKTQES